MSQYQYNFFLKIEKFLCYCLLSLMLDFTEIVSDSVDSNVEVWLTVSSIASFNKKTNRTYKRQLELNWRNDLFVTKDDWIALFNRQPNDHTIQKNGRKASLESVSVNQSSGSYRTIRQFPRHEFSKKKLRSRCLGYWIAYVRLDKVVAKNCIRNNPFWMEKSLDTIGAKSIFEITIAGTHNSASFDQFMPDQQTLLYKYSLCQEESVWNQLVYGIRFLDLRISCERSLKGEKCKPWIVHGPVRMKATLESVVSHIKDFIEAAPKEIVIIDLHRFEKGFDSKESSHSAIKRRHQRVAALIFRYLKDYIVPFQMAIHSSLNELISENKRIIVGYASGGYAKHELFFPHTRHLWPNADNLIDMEKYFNKTICERHPNSLQSVMAHLTPAKSGILTDKYKGLRTMAQSVNYNITNWFRNRWHQCLNIIASDYFLGNNIIEIAIKINSGKI